MPKLNDKELINAFIKEAEDLIKEIKTSLSLIKGRNTADTSKALFNVFRCSHILKSSAGIAGFTKLAEMTSALTEVFRAVKDGRFEIKPNVSPLLSESIDACQKLVEKKEVDNYNELLERLKILSIRLQK